MSVHWHLLLYPKKMIHTQNNKNNNNVPVSCHAQPSLKKVSFSKEEYFNNSDVKIKQTEI